MDEIRLARDVAAELLSHARENPDDECCGLLAGCCGVMTHAFPAQNAAKQRATSYEIAPKELFHMMREIGKVGLELLGIYHSHPNSDNQPSARDIERAYYPDAVYLILSTRENALESIRAFSIRDGKWMELRIQVV